MSPLIDDSYFDIRERSSGISLGLTSVKSPLFSDMATQAPTFGQIPRQCVRAIHTSARSPRAESSARKAS